MVQSMRLDKIARETSVDKIHTGRQPWATPAFGDWPEGKTPGRETEEG